MEKKLIPTHRYKISVIFLDDDPVFLDFLRENLKTEKYNLIFTNTIAGFNKFIEKSMGYRSSLPEVLTSFNNELNDTNEHALFDFNLSKFTLIKEWPNKSNEIGVVFIDNAMGNELGIDLCAQLSSIIKKILLTGQCDYLDAINAFNNRKIDMFMDKSSDDLLHKILEVMDFFVEKYFIEKDSYNSQLLCSKNLKDLFNNEIFTNHSIIAYYQIEKDAFLLESSNGEEFYLKCWLSKNFEEYYYMHYDEADIADRSYLWLIKERRLLPINGRFVEPKNYMDIYYVFEKANH